MTKLQLSRNICFKLNRKEKCFDSYILLYKECVRKFFIIIGNAFLTMERMVIMEAIKAIFSKIFELLPRNRKSIYLEHAIVEFIFQK